MRRYIYLFIITINILILWSGTYPYRRKLISRDHILERAHLFYQLRWYCSPENIYEDSSVEYARSPYAYGNNVGWQDTMPYCWGGDDDVYEFLEKTSAGVGAGDISSASSRPYRNGQVAGVDCSGYVSQVWRSGRYSTASFHRVTNEIGWANLAPGDAVNHAGSHIRLCEEYPVIDGGMLLYEATRGGGAWSMMHHVLPYQNNYVAVRYNFVSPRPSITALRQTDSRKIELRWYGDTGISNDDAKYGFKVSKSTDLKTWTPLPALNPLQNQSVQIDNISAEELYYFKVTSLKPEDESYSSNVFPVYLAGENSRRGKALLIDGFDQYMVNHSTEPHAIMNKYAAALAQAGISFDTVNNVTVTLQEVQLTDYDMLFWVLGDTDSTHRTLNHIEQDLLRDFLEDGGNLFISGSALGRDLVTNAPAVNNLGALNSNEKRCFTGFYNNYLKAALLPLKNDAKQEEDDEILNTLLGMEASIFKGIEVHFDNGTYDIYPVYNPDAVIPLEKSRGCLQYTNGNMAGIQYKGIFGSGKRPGKLVYLAVPFETFYPKQAAQEIIMRVVNFFEDEQ